MKRFILVASLLFLLFDAQSQNRDFSEITRNELKLNAGYLLLEYIEVSYEGLLDKESAIGISLGFPLSDFINYRFSAIPYFRLYFGEKYAAGFFIEGNLALISEEVNTIDFSFTNSSSVKNTEFTVGGGLAIGGKFLTRRGWIGEIFAGVGRNFVTGNVGSDGYSRVGITVGKRF